MSFPKAVEERVPEHEVQRLLLTFPDLRADRAEDLPAVPELPPDFGVVGKALEVVSAARASQKTRLGVWLGHFLGRPPLHTR